MQALWLQVPLRTYQVSDYREAFSSITEDPILSDVSHLLIKHVIEMDWHGTKGFRQVRVVTDFNLSVHPD